MAAPTGYSSLGLIGFTDKGDYAAATTYVQNDLVHYNGKIWKSKVDSNVGHTPASGGYWDAWIDFSDSLAEMTDTAISSPANGDVLEYDSATSKWKNSDALSEQKQALSNEVVTRSTLGAHNLLPNELQTQTVNGITFTRYDDGSFKANGTNSNANAGIDIFLNSESPIKPPAGNYVVSTENNIASTNSKLIAFAVMRYNNGVVGESIISIGNGANSANFTVDYNGYDAIGIKLWFQGGCSVSDLIIKPMIRLSTDSDNTYRPYVPTNSQLLSYKDNGVLGAKNLLDYALNTLKAINTSGTWANNVYTQNGIDYTVNSDLTITVNGTASPNSTFYIKKNASASSINKYNGMIFSGISSGDPNFYMSINMGISPFTIYAHVENAEVIIGNTNAIPNDTTSVDAIIRVNNGKTVSNVKTYPMIRLASDTDPTYQPYAMTNQQLTQQKFSYKDNGVLGAKNFASGKFTTVVNNGITYTANANDSVSFSGTIGSQNDYSLADSAVFTLKAGTYILSKNPVPGSGTNRSTVRLFISGGSAVVTLSTETEGTFTLASDSNVYIRIAFNGTGQSYSGTFYPMIRLASDTDPTYQPYAMTNKELTDRVAIEVNETYSFTDSAGKCSSISIQYERRVGNILVLDIAVGVGASAITAGNTIIDLTFSNITFVAAIGSSTVVSAGVSVRRISGSRFIAKAIGADIPANESFNISVLLFIS